MDVELTKLRHDEIWYLGVINFALDDVYEG